ncbi:MAG: hypothetical protein ABI604_14465, partial [Nitrospirota bacterium]
NAHPNLDALRSHFHLIMHDHTLVFSSKHTCLHLRRNNLWATQFFCHERNPRFIAERVRLPIIELKMRIVAPHAFVPRK